MYRIAVAALVLAMLFAALHGCHSFGVPDLWCDLVAAGIWMAAVALLAVVVIEGWAMRGRN